MTPKVEAAIQSGLKALEAHEELSVNEFLRIVNELRREIILTIAEHQEITAMNAQTIKGMVQQLIDKYGQRLTQQMSTSQHRAFVRGIQLIDRAIESNDLLRSVPYLSERTLEQLQNFGADLITGITDDARRRIANEITLAVLGQKPTSDVVTAIGRNIEDASVFNSIRRRAQIIYRTEINRIQSLAAEERLKQYGQQFPTLMKEWIHSHTGQPRPNHLLMHGERVKATDKFTLPGIKGGSYEVMGPYDPILPADETINCRCRVISTFET